MLGLIEEAFLLKISKAVNESVFDALKSKQNQKIKLVNLNNKVVKIILKSSIAEAINSPASSNLPNLSNLLGVLSPIKPEYYLCFENSQVKILRHLASDKPVDLTIVVTVNGILKAKIDSVDTALRDNDIELHGNLNVAMDLQALLNNADPEVNIRDSLQTKLSNLTSDAFAWRIMKLLDKIFSYVQLRNTELSEQLADYLQLESGLLVSQCEVDIFCNAVDKLQADVARLSARISKIEMQQ